MLSYMKSCKGMGTLDEQLDAANAKAMGLEAQVSP